MGIRRAGEGDSSFIPGAGERSWRWFARRAEEGIVEERNRMMKGSKRCILGQGK